jgi:hypothetical protein
VADVSTFPFNMDAASKPFVYNNKLWIFAEPASSAKLDGEAGDHGAFYSTVNGLIWTLTAAAFWLDYNLSVSPGCAEFVVVWNLLHVFAYYVMETTMKVDGATPTEEGEYLCYSKDITTWKYGVSYDSLELDYGNRAMFELNGKLYILSFGYMGDNIVKVLNP